MLTLGADGPVKVAQCPRGTQHPVVTPGGEHAPIDCPVKLSGEWGIQPQRTAQNLPVCFSVHPQPETAQAFALGGSGGHHSFPDEGRRLTALAAG